MLQQLFNAADTAVVGRFASSQAMAAVGSNSSVINLVVALFVGLSVGTNVVIAGLIGRGRREEIPSALHTAVLVAMISGVLLLFVGIGIARPMLTLMNTPEDVLDLAVLYLRIYFLGMPFIMLYNFGSAILRSKGDSTRPVYALLCGGIPECPAEPSAGHRVPPACHRRRCCYGDLQPGQFLSGALVSDA